MDKKYTIYDIAGLAGVSPATVSRVIHHPETVKETTAQKVWDAFCEAGVTPNQLLFKKTAPASPSSSAEKEIPVIMALIENWDNPFWHRIIQYIQDYVAQQGYEFIVYSNASVRSQPDEFLAMARSMNISGMIVMDRLPETTLNRMQAVCPVVQCSSYNGRAKNIPYVAIDDYNISRTAVSYFAETGCRRIGFFGSSMEFTFSQNRFNAYKSVLNEAGIPIRQDLIRTISSFSYDQVQEEAGAFFSLREPPDAVFCVSDLHAHAVILSAQRAGIRIPQEMKVIGFDNSLYATLCIPNITTVGQPIEQLAIRSAQLLLEIIRNPHAPVTPVLLPVRIIWRESTE